MDPYAAAQPQTYQPTTTPSSQIQQDPYIYAQQTTYDPYSYYSQPTTYDQSQQYVNPSVYQQPTTEQQYPQQQTEQQQQQQEHAPIHPPGVPLQPDPNQMAAYQQQGYAETYYQTDPNSYYYPQPQVQPQPVSYPDPSMVHSQWQQPQQLQQPQQQHHGQPGGSGLTTVYPPNGQGGQHSAPSRGGGRGFRGGSSSSFRGRGRGGGGGGSGGRGGGGSRGSGTGSGHGGGGRGGGGRGVSSRGGGRGVSSRGGGRGGRPSVSQPKPQFLAWCELCRIDCNTHEVLENHKNGKKHKKNLEIQEDLKRFAGKTQPEIEAMNAAAAAASSEQLLEVKDESKLVDSEEPQGNSMKRRMIEEERKSAEPMKRPKEAVPFICELCDVKCESAPVFDFHLKGKKHMFNLQRFQEQQATLGQVALQALYPALEAALYPVLIQALAQSASTSYAYGGLDQQVLQLLQPFLPQTGPPMFPPGPGYLPRGLNHGVTLQEVRNQVEPVNGTHSETEDQVEPESKTEDQVGPENKTEDQVEPERKTDDQVDTENGTEDQVEPENETEEHIETESKTEEVDPNAEEPTR